MIETSGDLIPDEAWINIAGAVGWDESHQAWPQIEAAVWAAAPFIATQAATRVAAQQR